MRRRPAPAWRLSRWLVAAAEGGRGASCMGAVATAVAVAAAVRAAAVTRQEPPDPLAWSSSRSTRVDPVRAVHLVTPCAKWARAVRSRPHAWSVIKAQGILTGGARARDGRARAGGERGRARRYSVPQTGSGTQGRPRGGLHSRQREGLLCRAPAVAQWIDGAQDLRRPAVLLRHEPIRNELQRCRERLAVSGHRGC